MKDQISVVDSESNQLDHQIDQVHIEMNQEHKIFLKFRLEEIQDLITGLHLFNL